MQTPSNLKEPQPSSRNINFMKHLAAIPKIRKVMREKVNANDLDQKLITSYLHFNNAKPY
jgi:hypothetical protein